MTGKFSQAEPPWALAKIFVTQMLTRNLFTVANFRCQSIPAIPTATVNGETDDAPGIRQCTALLRCWLNWTYHCSLFVRPDRRSDPSWRNSIRSIWWVRPPNRNLSTSHMVNIPWLTEDKSVSALISGQDHDTEIERQKYRQIKLTRMIFFAILSECNRDGHGSLFVTRCDPIRPKIRV